MDVEPYIEDALWDRGVLYPSWLPGVMADALNEETLYQADMMLASIGDGSHMDPLLLPHLSPAEIRESRRSATNGPFQFTVLAALDAAMTRGKDWWYEWSKWTRLGER